MTPLRPARFGRYALVDRLGEGGMSEVWKAIVRGPAGVEKLVAVKRIRSFLASDEEFVEMFTDEARVSSLLQHPGIVSVFDFGHVGQSWYLAMECVEGRDLRALGRRLLDTRRVLDIDQAVYAVHAMCEALHYAHRLRGLDGRPLGLVHRDIKPSNVLVSFDGDIKLLDFGIAKAVSNTRATGSGLLAGSAHYMSPEQASGLPLTARSDLFSAGVVLYELLTGRRLFRADTREDTLARVREAVVPPASQWRALPPGLEDVLGCALARDPADRFEDASAMAAALEPFVGAPGRVRGRLARLLDELFREERAADQSRLEQGRARLAEVGLADEEPTPPPAPDESATVVGLAPPPAPAPAAPPAPVEDAATEVVPLLTVTEAPPSPVTLSPPTERVVAPSPAATPSPAAAPPPALAPSPPPAVTPVARTARRGGLAWLGLLVGAGLLWWGASRAPAPEEERPIQAEIAPAAPAVEAPSPAPSAPEVSTPPAPSVAVAPVTRSTARTPAPAPSAAAPPEPPPEAPPAAPEPAPAPPEAPAPSPAPAEAAAATAQDAHLSVSVSAGWARVYLDGALVSRKTPLVDHALAPGTYEVRIEQPSSGRVWRRKVTLEPGQDARVNFDVE